MHNQQTSRLSQAENQKAHQMIEQYKNEYPAAPPDNESQAEVYEKVQNLHR